MLASLVLAASLVGQIPYAPNVGYLWTGTDYVLTTLDTSKPLKFQGGGLSMDLVWNPALSGWGGGFESLPFIVAGLPYPVTLQFYPFAEGEGPGPTWALVEVGQPNIGDYETRFDSASASPLNISSRATPGWPYRMWAIARAGATNYTLGQ